MSFADQIKKERERLGITQAQAASLLSISKRAYCYWESSEIIPHRYMQEGSLRDLKEPDAHTLKTKTATPLKKWNTKSHQQKETDSIRSKLVKIPVSTNPNVPNQ